MIMIGQLAPMTLMREPHHPWYIGYTTVWGMLSFFVFSPAILGTALIGETAILGQEGLSVAHWILNIIWLIFLCYLVSCTNAIIPGAAANIAWQQRPAPPDHRLEERPKNH